MNQHYDTPRVHPPGVVIPLEWLTMFRNMSREQAGESLVAILTYGATGALPEGGDPTLNALWPIFQARLDSDRERYCQKVERTRACKEQRSADRTAPSSAPRKTGRPAPQSRAEYEKALDKWL